MRHTDPNDLLDPVGPDPVLPPTPVEPTVPVQKPEVKKSKTKWILLAIALIVALVVYLN